MGTYSSIEGEMTFSRALKPGEITDTLRRALNDIWSVWELTEETTSEEDAEDGAVITRTRYTGISLKYTDEIKAIGYGWEKTFQQIVDALPGLPSPVTVTGVFEGVAENTGDGYDAERLYVTHPERRVVVVKPTVTWPDVPKGASA